jgi:signal transduction histidine kinase
MEARIGRAGRGGDGLDRLQPFANAVLAFRWVTVTVGVALVVADDPDVQMVAWTAVVVANAVIRTIRPIRFTTDTSGTVAVGVSAALHLAAVCATGFWDSPLTFTLLTPVLVAGFARGVAFAVGLSVLIVAGVTAVQVVVEGTDVELDVRWAVLLSLVALLGSYARRISGEASRRQLVAMDRLGRLADANALLFALHRAAQTLPTSLDLDETVESTVTRLRDLFDHDVATLLLLDDTDQGWSLARADGPAAREADLPTKIRYDGLPPPLARAVAGGFLVEAADLSRNGPGLWPEAGSGLYIVLQARGLTVGLIALEHHDPGHFDRRDIELLSGYVEPAALAIDNARWFSRLRTIGAEEERTRLARELHDRIGQSLAYLAFELDRVVRARDRGEEIGPDLEQLRDDVRRVVSEVRDTLYDLRTEVTETQDILTALGLLGDRVRGRTDMAVTVGGSPSGRLPLPQERELFRIAQEAVVNVERHAKASTIGITWWSDGRAAILEVTDDGQGFPVGRSGRSDSYGLVGMRERAASVGATLSVDSLPGKGTRIRCVLGEDRARQALPGVGRHG